jgi:hypothetical protein
MFSPYSYIYIYIHIHKYTFYIGVQWAQDGPTGYRRKVNPPIQIEIPPVKTPKWEPICPKTSQKSSQKTSLKTSAPKWEPKSNTI